jgi:F420-0:gamma-glutamyl ligase
VANSVEEIEVTCFAELLLSSTEGRTASLESVESDPHTNTEMSITYPVSFQVDHQQ